MVNRPSVHKEPQMKNREILVVDDETAIRELFKDTLGRAGYAVICAGSAEEALEILKKRNRYVMFFDIKLAGMSGIELCREVRKDNHIALVFAMTGYAGLFELSDCRGAGFDDYFPKPIRVETILEAAREAFEKLDRWRGKESAPPKSGFDRHPVSSPRDHP